MHVQITSDMFYYIENNGGPHAETKTGEKSYSFSYPKYKSGGYILRKITEKCSRCPYGQLLLLCVCYVYDNSYHDIM